MTKKCKDCKHNGECEFQDAPPEGTFTKEQIENMAACSYFKYLPIVEERAIKKWNDEEIAQSIFNCDLFAQRYGRWILNSDEMEYLRNNILAETIEETWFDQPPFWGFRGTTPEYNNDSLMAKYWAAEEIGKKLSDELYMDIFNWIYPVHDSYLIQLLKKEWFR